MKPVLACLAIIVWHFYHVVFDPDVYPLNLACWRGDVSRHWLQEEHPLDPSLEANGVPAQQAEASKGGRAREGNEPAPKADIS